MVGLLAAVAPLAAVVRLAGEEAPLAADDPLEEGVLSVVAVPLVAAVVVRDEVARLGAVARAPSVGEIPVRLVAAVVPLEPLAVVAPLDGVAPLAPLGLRVLPVSDRVTMDGHQATRTTTTIMADMFRAITLGIGVALVWVGPLLVLPGTTGHRSIPPSTTTLPSTTKGDYILAASTGFMVLSVY